MKIVFFGTSSVALPVLDALHKNHEIVAVVTQPDALVGRDKVLTKSLVASWAEVNHLTTLKPLKVKGNLDFLAELTKLNADIFIVVSYGQILPTELINLPRLKTLNIHFSLLPKYRGASPIQFALLNGDSETGTTIFVLDEKMDTGPILATQKYPIEPYDNFITLSKKLADASADLLIKILPDYAGGKIIPQPQDDVGASYTKIISKEDGRIDWNKTATEIYNMLRAFTHWPGIWTIWDGKKLKITEAEPHVEMQEPKFLDYKGYGYVIARGVVTCGKNTYLKIKKLQLEGKKEIEIDSFLNGYKTFVGSKLL